MFKKAKPKRVNKPNRRSFVAIYERVPRDKLPPNETLKRRYKQRSAAKNKCRQQGGRCIFIFIKNIAKSPAVKGLGRTAIKKTPVLFDNIKHEK